MDDSNKQPTPVRQAPVKAAGRPVRRKRLAPSQKYEIFTATLTSSATQRELADKYGVLDPRVRTDGAVASPWIENTGRVVPTFFCSRSTGTLRGSEVGQCRPQHRIRPHRATR